MTEATTAISRTGTLRELPTDEGVLRYHEVGEGPPLLLLHGSGPGVTGWRNYRGNLTAFSRHFRCLVLELPGFGVSDATPEHPMVAAPKAVQRFLAGLGLDRVDVVGNSMGGIVAANLAIEHPGLFKRIVTVGGIGPNIFSPAPGEGINLLVDFTENPTREALVRWMHSMVHDPDVVTEEMIEERWIQATDPDTLAAARRMYGRKALTAAMASAEQSDQPPYWAMLHRIGVPALITWGRDDRVSPVDMALLPMRTMPRAELHVLPDCGHWVMIEQKEAWESAVLAFLTRPGSDN
ncbi:alpha/beta fold hydrolase [Streptomyces sp. ID03-2B]|uniref:Alpha/beta fold hydrolase n=1 Tax=Streptomyces caviscabies TaxID=90079 RepID=A0ABW2MBZ9_9ACTN|nr:MULTISPECIES: alpha/beta fold hydrolase [unclassified Streptomyces]MCL6289143.1 alpha/beta fold hydrolase [Streptomyces sp. 43Y-GA-1]MDX3339037.1 alpha/beta fold hydrolase [Streptomyces sp. ME02-6979.5a]MDX3506404.1 alpha/beta fold hydrolase [Streptomyces sp. ATCC51928]MDX3589881.1 alpha/beta fold hydrolase [Streptomyces sp. ID03-2B]MDX5522251.1 alpha/beta fold hydrolase [Streptomyces sp. DE06-01C]